MWSGFTGDCLYLDTNIIVYAVEEGNPWTSPLRSLFEAIDQRAIRAVTSELTLAEAIAKPLALGANDLVSKYEKLLAANGLITVVPIDRTMLRAAAEFQGRSGTKLLDAIHLATAKQLACDFILTNDKRLSRNVRDDFRWISLPEIVGHGSEP